VAAWPFSLTLLSLYSSASLLCVLTRNELLTPDHTRTHAPHERYVHYRPPGRTWQGTSNSMSGCGPHFAISSKVYSCMHNAHGKQSQT
jgi:hypothetical protein